MKINLRFKTLICIQHHKMRNKTYFKRRQVNRVQVKRNQQKQKKKKKKKRERESS
jgi:hypothetical protein